MEALEVVAEEAKGGVAEDGRVGFDLLHEQLQLFHLRRIHGRRHPLQRNYEDETIPAFLL